MPAIHCTHIKTVPSLLVKDSSGGSSGGSCGLGALGPAILWGPLQHFSTGGLRAPEAPQLGPGQSPVGKAFGNNILKIG